MNKMSVPLITLLAVVAGFAGGFLVANVTDEPVQLPSPRNTSLGPDESELPLGWTSCSNETYEFSIGYPANWDVAGGSPELECRWFDPNPITLTPASEGPRTAMQVIPEGPSYAEAVMGITDTTFADVIKSEEIRLKWTQATRFETVSRGQGLDEAGTTTYGYVIEMGESGFVVQTQVAPDRTDLLAAYKPIIDQAVASLRYVAAVKPSS